MGSLNAVVGPVAVSAPGSMAIAAPDGVTPMVSVNGSAYTALGGGGMSSDVLVKATVGMVGYALELLASLTSATPGAETAKWQIFLDKLGTLVSALDIRPDGTYFPQGSAAAPAISFQGDAVAQASGFYWSQGSSALVAIINGATQFLLQTGKLTLFPDASQILMGTLNQVVMGIAAGAQNAQMSSTLGNMQLGIPGALATNTTKGFVDLPTCAGAPSGVPANTEAGHKSMIYDTTNNKLWIYNGSWRGVVVT
jgi:hypothetical protein